MKKTIALLLAARAGLLFRCRDHIDFLHCQFSHLPDGTHGAAFYKSKRRSSKSKITWFISIFMYWRQLTRAHMVFPGLDSSWRRYPR